MLGWGTNVEQRERSVPEWRSTRLDLHPPLAVGNLQLEVLFPRYIRDQYKERQPCVELLSCAAHVREGSLQLQPPQPLPALPPWPIFRTTAATFGSLG